MLTTYDTVFLKQRLHSLDPIEINKAIYTLLKKIEELEDQVSQLEKTVAELKAK